MKKFFKVLTILAFPFVMVGCASQGGSSKADESKTTSSSATSTSTPASTAGKSSSVLSSATHVHEWATAWSNDGTQHYHACAGCNEKKDAAN